MAGKTLNAWWLRKGEGGRFVDPVREQMALYTDDNSLYWHTMAQEAGRRAITILGREEYCRRLDILWPDEENRSWKQTAMINREAVDGEQWHK